MTLDDLVQRLDEKFGLAAWGPDPAMRKWIPRTYGAIQYPYDQVFEQQFCERFNGLMLRSSDNVQKVFCCSFPTPDVISTVIERADRPALIFAHHPVDMEVSGRGFLPIAPDHLEALQTNAISFYAVHAPLDGQDSCGTNSAILQELDLREIEKFVSYGQGYAGRIAEFETPHSLDCLATIRRSFQVPRLEIGGNAPREISRVAVVAGGGDDLDIISEAADRGCDMYLSGEWYFRQKPQDDDVRARFVATNQAIFNLANDARMLLVAVSHAASEFLVMPTQIARYLEGLGLDVECVPQEDWWR